MGNESSRQEEEEAIRRKAEERLKREKEDKIRKEEEERRIREDQDRIRRVEEQRNRREEQDRMSREEQERSRREEQIKSKNKEQERVMREQEGAIRQLRLDADRRLQEEQLQEQLKKEKEEAALLEKEWRPFEKGGSFTEDYANRLLSDIQKNAVQLSEIRNINILLAGPIKAGKSSIVNTLASVDKGRMSQVTVAGGAGKSMTKKLKPFKPKDRLKNFKIYDTMGVEEGDIRGLNVKDVMYVVNGNVPPNYKFNPASPIDRNTVGFKKNPTVGDRIHCMAFVMNANVVGNENISEAAKKKIKALQDELEEAEIPRIVMLTQIDVLCEKVENDITKTYISRRVKNAVDIAKELFNMPEQNIFPVQNYSNEVETDFRKEILAMLALRQMLRFATDFLDELCEDED